MKDLEEQLQTVKNESEKVKFASNSNAETKLKELTEEIKFFKDQKDGNERDKKKLKDKVKALEGELEECAESIEMSEMLTIKLQKEEAKNENLKQELEGIKTELKNAKSMINAQGSGEGGPVNQNLQEEVEILNETLTLQESDLKEAKEQNEVLAKEI